MNEIMIILQFIMMILFIIYLFNSNKASHSRTVVIDKENRKVTLDLTIDTKISPVLDYFEIFMDRTMMSKYAAKYLGIWFELVINDTRLL